MINIVLPAIWLIILIVGLPQLSETVYTPSLPDISKALNASESMVEYTLTIYLLGFAIGTLFWGTISDKLGRKPCVLGGLLVFILGTIACYFSKSINSLLISRFVQALGGSIGSVLGQAIVRDSFHGPNLGKVYSSIGSALAIFPAIGPVIGGLISEKFGWSSIFLFLTLFAIILLIIVQIKLPETHFHQSFSKADIKKTILKLFLDNKVLGYGLIIAACNGILFSYFAEGSFYLIRLMNLSPSKYGISFLLISLATMLGGITSKNLHKFYNSKKIMNFGLGVILLSTLVFSVFAILQINYHFFGNNSMIAIIISSQMISSFGICIATSNALALSLSEYKSCIGIASSLFGFFYYCLISLFTLGMGWLHNGSLLPMPLYFFSLSIFMILVEKTFLRNN